MFSSVMTKVIAAKLCVQCLNLRGKIFLAAASRFFWHNENINGDAAVDSPITTSEKF